jgi:rubredoxin
MEQPKSWWKCSTCGYLLQAATPPEVCPGCNEKCVFIDTTCYTPECGGPDNIDPQIAQNR